MTTRRDLLQTTAGALASLVFVGCGLTAASTAQAQTRRREVVVNGKRVKTVDIHAHCAVPEALALMNAKLGGPGLRTDLDMATEVSTRLKAMDEQGIDVEALSINPNWYKVDRDLAKQIIKIQNEKLAEACAQNPDRFVAFATVALQFPDLAAEQLEEGVKKYGLRGAAIGGNVAGLEISDPKFHPFWAKAEQLGVLVFIHPQGDGAPAQLDQRFKGNGYLNNVIGNPLETHTLQVPGSQNLCGACRRVPALLGGRIMAARLDPISALAGRMGLSRRPRQNTSSRCITTRWSSTRRACATWLPRWARAGWWWGATIPIHGRRPRLISSFRRRV